MTTSGTYAFNPAMAETVIYALNLCGVRGTAILTEHMGSARMATNMMLGRWSSEGVNLWTVDLQTVPLIQGQSTYDVPPNTIVMLDAYIVTNATGLTNNRLILPVSRSEYASYPNPQQQGSPTVFWFDRLLSPTVTLYYVPNGEQVSLNYYRVRQIQDANFANGQTVEIPYYFLEAFAYGLAQRLAVIWAPDRAAGLKGLADEAYQIAVQQNVETSDFFISPSVQSYFSP